jgi:hypothetical protein
MWYDKGCSGVNVVWQAEGRLGSIRCTVGVSSCAYRCGPETRTARLNHGVELVGAISAFLTARNMLQCVWMCVSNKPENY